MLTKIIPSSELIEQYIFHPENRSFFQHPYVHLIIAPYEFNRIGNCSLNDLEKIILSLQEYKINWSLEFDDNFPEYFWNHQLHLLSFLNKAIFAECEIRVRDVGMLYYLLNNYSQNLFYLAEGMHNTEALNVIVNMAKERLRGFMLCPESSVEMIKTFQRKMNFQNFELLVFGRILLLNSPRKLITANEMLNQNDNANSFENIQEEQNKQIDKSVWANSEESPHNGFFVHENIKGTFFFHPKIVNIASDFQEIINLGLSTVVLNLKTIAHDGFEKEHLLNLLSFWINPNENHLEKLIGQINYATFKGLFLNNRTNQLFSKLKNHYLLRDDQKYFGRVVDMKREEYLVVELASGHGQINQESLNSQKFELTTPDGKKMERQLKVFQTLSSLKLEQQYLLCEPIKAVVVGTIIEFV